MKKYKFSLEMAKLIFIHEKTLHNVLYSNDIHCVNQIKNQQVDTHLWNVTFSNDRPSSAEFLPSPIWQSPVFRKH